MQIECERPFSAAWWGRAIAGPVLIILAVVILRNAVSDFVSPTAVPDLAQVEEASGAPAHVTDGTVVKSERWYEVHRFYDKGADVFCWVILDMRSFQPAPVGISCIKGTPSRRIMAPKD